MQTDNVLFKMGPMNLKFASIKVHWLCCEQIDDSIPASNASYDYFHLVANERSLDEEQVEEAA